MPLRLKLLPHLLTTFINQLPVIATSWLCHFEVASSPLYASLEDKWHSANGIVGPSIFMYARSEKLSQFSCGWTKRSRAGFQLSQS